MPSACTRPCRLQVRTATHGSHLQALPRLFPFQPLTLTLPGTRAVGSGLWAALVGGEQPCRTSGSRASGTCWPASPWKGALNTPGMGDSDSKSRLPAPPPPPQATSRSILINAAGLV